jgi:hypothetical protein
MSQSSSGEASRYREDVLSVFAPRITEEGVSRSGGMPYEGSSGYASADNGACREIQVDAIPGSVRVNDRLTATINCTVFCNHE